MKSTIVSVRMPSDLISKLRTFSQANHYLDLSELLRSVVRTKCLQYTTPYAHSITKVVRDIEKEVEKKRGIEDKKLLIGQLQNIIEELKND